MSEELQHGDIITIGGVYADGTRERSETPPEKYLNKPLQYFRVEETIDRDGITATRIVPIETPQ